MLAILGLIPTILTFITGLGGTAAKISGDIRDREIAKEKTKSDTKLKELDNELQALHDKKDVLVAESGNRINGTLRAFIAIGPAAYIFKYFFIDKVVGSLVGCSKFDQLAHCAIFRTDPLIDTMAAILGAVVSFYLLTTWKTK